MQISRHLLLTCAVAMYLTPTWLQAYDNQAQIRARQALEEKMNQIDAQTLATTSSPPATVTNHAPSAKPKRAQHPTHPAPATAQSSPAVAPEISQPATPRPATPAAPANSAADEKLREALREKMGETQAPATPAAAAPAAPRSQPAPVAAPEYAAPAVPTNSEADEKLREALHDKMNENEAGSPMPAPATPTPAAPVMPSAPATPIAKPAPSPEPAPSAPMYGSTPEPSTNPAANEKLQEALREKMNQNEGNQAATTQPMPMQPAPAPMPASPARAKAPTQPVMTLPPLAGPPSSLTPAKQQKLDELLQLYRADRLTPEQYHDQRAKILSEP